MNTFKVGQRVLYRGSFGADSPVKGRIVDSGRKNGAAVYDVELDRIDPQTGEKDVAWGYADQLTPIKGD